MKRPASLSFICSGDVSGAECELQSTIVLYTGGCVADNDAGDEEGGCVHGLHPRGKQKEARRYGNLRL